MSNQVNVNMPVSVITLPDSLPIENCKAFVKQCFSHESAAFSTMDNTAKAEALRLLLVGIAVAGAAFNDTSKVERLRSYAVTLPSVKQDKNGNLTGRAAKLLAHCVNAAAIGKSLFISGQSDVDLAFMLSLPSWSGLINAAFPQPKKAEALPLNIASTDGGKAEAAAEAAKAAADKAAAEAAAAAAADKAAAEAAAKAAAAAEAAAKAAAEAAAKAEADKAAMLDGFAAIMGCTNIKAAKAIAELILKAA